MITIDTDPIANPIYLGGIILKFFLSSDSRKAAISDLYNYVNSVVEISFDIYLITLDWLYVIGLIEMDDGGEIIYEAK